MNIPESNYRAAKKYKRENCRRITFELNKKLDEDILVWLDSQENKQGYLKELIRADMRWNGFRLPNERGTR